MKNYPPGLQTMPEFPLSYLDVWQAKLDTAYAELAHLATMAQDFCNKDDTLKK